MDARPDSVGAILRYRPYHDLMPPDDRTPRAAHCPRCGYDLRGTVATWAESCPLGGVCNECGLNFDWADVLRADRNGPRWCIEYEKFRRRLPRSAARTFFHSFWPWGFWRDLQMHHKVQPRRLAAYAVLLIVPSLLCYLLVQSSVAIYVRWLQAESLRQQQMAIPRSIVLLQQTLTSVEQSTSSYASLTDAERATFIARYKVMIAQYQQALTNPGRVEFPYALAVIEAILFPLGRTSWGEITDSYFGQTYSYPPPRALWSVIGSAGVTSDQLVLPAIAAVILGTIGIVIFPFSLVLLPITRRRCKVRWSHIFRAGVYSLFIPITTIACSVILVALSLQFLISEDSAITAAFILPWLLLILWWSAAMRRYMRIPHAEFTVVVHAVMCGLLIPAVVVVLGWLL